MGRETRRTPGRVTTFQGRLLIPVLATLGVTGGLSIAGSGTPRATVARAAAVQGRPNVVVIESDDQTLNSMRVMRNVNALIGARGATFKKSFANFALCCPSRATFLTGEYAHNHRVMSNQAPSGGFRRFESLHGHNNLAVWLHRAGYYTAMIGKYLNGYLFYPRVPPGWSEWHATANQKNYDYTLDENGPLVKYGQRPQDYKQDVLTGKAVRFIYRRAPRASPFFLWLTYTSPHVSEPPHPNPPFNCGAAAYPAPRHAHAFDSEPLPKPPNFNEPNVSDKPAEIRNRPRLTPGQVNDIQRKYRCELESLLSVDEGVKRVIAALRANGELRKTLVVYTSDNGYFHGEHRIPDGKGHIYEESIRVPLEMRGPGIPPGVKIGQLVINADLAPTIVDVANASPGLVMDGRSLIPVAQRPRIERGRELLIEQPSFKAIRTWRYMYAAHRTGEKELYDLREDPFERHSVHDAPGYSSIRAQLARHLRKLKACAGRDCRLHSPP